MKLTKALLLLTSLLAGCTEYEYEEEVYLRTDGSGEIYINGARELFTALHGIGSPPDPDLVISKALRRFYDSPELRVISVRSSRRRGRTYFHVRARFEDLNDLSHHPGFAERRFRLVQENTTLVLRADMERGQRLTTGARRLFQDGLVALRFHFPSRVLSHNSPTGVERGNIIRWEYPISNYLRGDALHLEARFDRRTVLQVTLMLLAAAAGMVVVVIGGSLYALTWLGRRELAAEPDTVSSPARGRP